MSSCPTDRVRLVRRKQEENEFVALHEKNGRRMLWILHNMQVHKHVTY